MKNLITKVLLLCACFALPIFLSGQTTFMKTLQGAGDDTGNAVIATADGNYLLVGKTSASTSVPADGYLAKVNGNGEILWSKAIGGSAEEELLGAMELPNSDVILLGYTESFGTGNEDIFISRVTKDGEEIWAKTFGGTNDERADGMIQTSDGNILISGWTKSYGAGQLDVLVMKINPDGETIWSKTFGRSGNEWCNFGGLLEDAEGNYIVSGAWTNNFGITGHNGFLFKLNSMGELNFSRVYGGSDNDGMNGYLHDQDGIQHSIGGAWSWNGFNHEIWMSEIGSNGSLNWSKTFGIENRNIRIGSTRVTAEGDFIIAGHDFSEITEGFGILMKVNPAGDVLWAKKIGGAQVEKIYCSIETADGILSFGNTSSFAQGPTDILMLKTDLEGNGPGCTSDLPLLINTVVVEEVGATNEFISTFPAGASTSFTSTVVDLPEYYICDSIVSVDQLPIDITVDINIYPNPTDGYFQVAIEKINAPVTRLGLYNSLGKYIEQKEFSGTAVQAKFDLGKWPAGIYYLEIENENGRSLKKIVHVANLRRYHLTNSFTTHLFFKPFSSAKTR